MPPNLGLLKTKRGKATLALASACRIEFLSSFHFPPWATPCLVDVNVYVFPVNALDEALATNPTTIAAASVIVRPAPLFGVICAGLYPRQCSCNSTSSPGSVVDTVRHESQVILRITSVISRPTIGSPISAPSDTTIALAT